MMDSLSDVITCCRGLALEKITDRKKNSEKVRQLLCKSSVLKALDKYTDNKAAGNSDGNLTWDYVFKAVAQYVLIETEHLRKSKEQASAASQTRKEKAKKEVSDLFKFVIRQADKRGPRLKCSLVLNHVDEVLQDEYMCHSYGVDYTNILLKNVLNVRKYWVEISSTTWHNLIGLFVKMYTSQSFGIDKTLLSRVISTLIAGATNQCDLRPKRLLSFFTEVFKNIRHERTSVVIENLLSALNMFVDHIAVNSRTQICKLGETVFINMLYIWENRPTVFLKNELVKFLSTQMHAHHPGGRKRDEVGSFAVDWDVWMSHLRKLYEVLYGDFQHIGGRKRFSGGNKEVLLPSDQIDLAAEVCNQLFQSTEHVIEVTQLSLTSSEDRPGAKKRRLESGWMAIRDIITSLGNTEQITPWLQLITRVMEKFPQSLAEDEVYPYLCCLSSLVAESKKVEITKYLLICIGSFAENWERIKYEERKRELCVCVWRKIWSSTLRCVSLHHATPQGYQLLKAILTADIIHPDRDMWSLFLPNINRPTQDAVNFLLSVLQKFNIPEKFQPGILTSANYGGEQYPLRSQLMDWLMPSSEDISGSSLANISSEIDPDVMAHVLVLLTIKNQSAVDIKENSSGVVPTRTDLEITYLQTARDFPVTNKFLEIKPLTQNQEEILHLPILLSKLEKMLHEEVSSYLDITDILMKHVDGAVTKVCMISKMIFWLLKYGVVSPETLLKMDIVSLLKTLLKKLASFMAEILQKEGPSTFLNTFKTLQVILDNGQNQDKANIQASKLVRCLFPGKIIDQLINIVSNKSSNKHPSTSSAKSDIDHIRLSSRHRASTSRRMVDDDDMDLEFDQPVAKDQGEEDLDDEFGDSQNSDDTNTDAFQSPLCPSSLTEIQTIKLHAVKILCLWCGYDKPEMKESLPMETSYDAVHVRTKLEELIDEEILDSNRPFDLQMLDIVVSYLTSKSHRVGDSDLENMLDAIRRVSKYQRKDHSISCLCLSLLGHIVPYLDNDEMPSKTIQDCRDIATHLLLAFWKLQGQFSSRVRLATAKCMMAFIEVDPKREWTILSMDEDEQAAVSEEFIQTMCDLSHNVRLYSSQLVSRLFVSGLDEPVPVNRHQQNQLFDKIYVIINETMDIRSKQGSLSAERAQDEKNNRTASALTTVGNIMCTSVVCENKAIFALCQLTRECEIDIGQVQNVIQKVSHHLGYKDGHQFMSYHLPYVLNQWLGLNYPVEEFPYQVTFCTSLQEFYRSFYHFIIPQLFMTKNVLAAKEVVTKMNASWTDVLKQCIPKIVVHMLPLFAVASSTDVPDDETLKKRASHATACYDLLTREATKEVVEKTIVSSLDDIVVNILMCYYNPEEDFIKNGSIRNVDPEPNPPCYNTYMIMCTLEYLTRSFSGSARTLVDVLSKNQDSIQKILLDLALKLTKEHRLHEKRRLFMMYQLFVKQLLREFNQQLGGSWAFVLRETIHRLVFITNDVVKLHLNGVRDCGYSENLVCICLQLLRDICTVGLESCPEELTKYLSFIVGHLVEIVNKEKGDIVNEAKALLQLLIVDNYATLRQAIVSLDPFPGSEHFQQLSTVHQRLKYASGPFNLTRDIAHFMATSSMCNIRKEGLQHLNERMHQNKDQLALLTSQHSGKNHKICQLICKLVHLYNGNDADMTVEISRCLGEIGPIDLVQSALPNIDDRLSHVTSRFCGMEKNYCRIFHILNEYLVDSDMFVVEAASGVLKTLLNTQTGFDFANVYRERLGDTDYLFQYLHPFKPRKKGQVEKAESLSVEEFQPMVDSETLWTPVDGCHDNWIQNLSSVLIDAGVQDEILSKLQPICRIKTKLSEMILPLLIHDLLQQYQPIHREILSSQISRFFSIHCNHGNTGSRSNSALSLSFKDTNICQNKDSIRTMLNVVQYLRLQDRPKQGRREMTAWDNNFWLELDFLHLSRAALYCSAHFSAVLFAEIWCDIQRQKKDYSDNSQRGTGFSQSFSQATVIDSLGSAATESAINVQDLLLEAYQQIGDPDGLYGCGAGRLANTSSRVKSYEHENKWDKAVITYDIEMCQMSTGSQFELLKALQNFGSSHILDKYLDTMPVSGQDIPDHIRDLQYEAAWKAGQWNLEASSRIDETCGFNEAVYSALTAVKDNHSSLAKKSIDIARMLAMRKLSTSSMESAQCLYPVLADLQCVSQIDDVLYYDILKREGYQDLTTRWNSFDSIRDNDFMFLEPTLTMRCSVLNMLLIKHTDPSLNVCLQHQLLKLAELARTNGRHQIAERAIFNLKEMETDDLKLHIPKLIEEANLFWTRQEQSTAKHLMKNLITKLEKLQDENIDAARFYPQVLSIYGNWLAETRSENPNVIMEEYLEKTVGLLESLDEHGDIALDAYLSLARFADSQYQNIVNYMNSNTYEAKQALMRKAKAEIETLEQLGDTSKDRYYKILSKQSEIDKAEVEAMDSDKNKFLTKAVENYLMCLKYGDKHDLRIFRLVSLWFSNSSLQSVNTLIEKSIKMLKSYKFLPLMYQLAARMTTNPPAENGHKFQAILNHIIETAALDHPHHTLLCVLALAHAKKDAEIMKSATNRRSKLSKSNSDSGKDEGRIEAAKLMILRLKDKKSSVAEILTNLERLCTAYIQLANFDVSQYKKETRPIQLQSNLLITKIKDLDNVALPTVDIKVDPTCQYKDIISVKGFNPTFKLAGGVNLPKIISCIGSDGKSRRQLVKGRDDLRQDAVMEQVFGMVNNLLQKNSETRKRRLHVRQYKVVPLSQMSGLLEWCEGTMPIGEYLVASSPGDESPGAHCRYRPDDYTAIECRRHMAAVHTSPDSTKKYKIFMASCKKFLPVFRHFFMEKFQDPARWYEARLAYTKSVATNSIVGYILGLGDRHVQNILVDCNTAELVHIDLGVAFEQGKILPTPETVPFRLTRDIVDGMGVSGVEGVFRRCCEKTMEVMHNNQEALLTILEVLLYDPLYAWCMSPAKAYALQHRRDRNDPDASELNATKDILEFSETNEQNENNESVNKLAERVLLRLHQKLQGIEDGVQLSVSGQVNLLIQEARDPKNLAKLYPGWQPYI